MCCGVSVHHRQYIGSYPPVLDWCLVKTQGWLGEMVTYDPTGRAECFWCRNHTKSQMTSLSFLSHKPACCQSNGNTLRSALNFVPLRKMHVKEESDCCLVAQELCLIMSVNSLMCVCVRVCAFMCIGVEKQGPAVSFTHASPTVKHTGSPGTEWYSILVSGLLSHSVFALLYLQTIHRTHLSGEEAEAHKSPHFLWLRIPILSGGKKT